MNFWSRPLVSIQICNHNDHWTLLRHARGGPRLGRPPTRMAKSLAVTFAWRNDGDVAALGHVWWLMRSNELDNGNQYQTWIDHSPVSNWLIMVLVMSWIE